MKVIKAVLKWRKRYYEMKLLKENILSHLDITKKSLKVCKSRYAYLLEHNVILAAEMDNLNKLFDVLKSNNNEQ